MQYILHLGKRDALYETVVSDSSLLLKMLQPTVQCSRCSLCSTVLAVLTVLPGMVQEGGLGDYLATRPPSGCGRKLRRNLPALSWKGGARGQRPPISSSSRRDPCGGARTACETPRASLRLLAFSSRSGRCAGAETARPSISMACGGFLSGRVGMTTLRPLDGGFGVAFAGCRVHPRCRQSR